MKSPQQQRKERQHEEKLEEVRRQVDSGSLVIRQMTDAERTRYAPKPRPKKKR